MDLAQAFLTPSNTAHRQYEALADGRLGETGRSHRVAELEGRLCELCNPHDRQRVAVVEGEPSGVHARIGRLRSHPLDGKRRQPVRRNAALAPSAAAHGCPAVTGASLPSSHGAPARRIKHRSFMRHSLQWTRTWNARGHQVAARAIVETLLKEGIFEPRLLREKVDSPEPKSAER